MNTERYSLQSSVKQLEIFKLKGKIVEMIRLMLMR